MTNTPDRLDEIKQCYATGDYERFNDLDYAWWLIAEVERLRDEICGIERNYYE